jgi:serpin B
MNRRTLLALSGALATGLAGCLGTSDGGGDFPAPRVEANTESEVSEEALEALVEGNTRFAFDLFETLADDGNLFVSPYSVSVALAMTYAGARGETETEMEETLRFGLDQEELHPAFNALAVELGERSEAEVDDDEGDPFALHAVNALWGLEGYPYREAYLETVERNYGAGFNEVDFRDDPEGAREAINAWVAEHTEDRIDDLLPEGSIDELVRLVLTNAIYFQATWAKTFSEDRTEEASFTALSGETSTVPMMRQSESFPYAAVDGTQVVELPYVGEEVSMVVVLPPEGEFEAFEEGFDADRYTELVSALEDREGRIELPRFEFESSVALQEALEALGMPIAFDEHEADFDGMIDLEAAGENVYIDDVYHDSYVAVDEEGTEAAAATAVVMRAESAPADPFEMVVDRPFLFAIRDRPTGTVLFLGRVLDAAAE